MDAEIASNDQSNDDHTDDGEDAHGALISLRTWLSCGFHYAFTLVVVIGPAYWTLDEGMGRRLTRALLSVSRQDQAKALALALFRRVCRRSAGARGLRCEKVTVSS